MKEAKALAREWTLAAQRDWAMDVHADADALPADGGVVWEFSRSGADGTLQVTPERFVLAVRLGFLLGTFKERIEAQLLKNLGERLAR